MERQRSAAQKDQAHERAASTAHEPAPAVARILELQRSTGNRAVRQLVARWWDETGAYREDPKPADYVSFIEGGQQRWRAAAPAAVAPAPVAVVAAPVVAPPVVGLKAKSKDSHLGRWAAKAPGREQVPEPDKEFVLPVGAPVVTDTNKEWRIDPRLVNFTQSNIDRKFQTSTPSGAINLTDALTKLHEGKDKVGNIPIARLVLSPNGRLVTLDNRRVYLAKRYANEKAAAQKKAVQKESIDKIRVRWATVAEYEEEYYKFTSKGKHEGTEKIKVRK